MASVLEVATTLPSSSARPQCITSPKRSKCDLSRRAPHSRSARVRNAVPASSAYRPDLRSKQSPSARTLRPVRTLSGAVQKRSGGNPCSSRIGSNVSMAAWITKRKRTGAMLSPCLTPTVESKTTSTPPTVSLTRTLVCSMPMRRMRCAGTPYLPSMSNMAALSTESKALTRSTKSTQVPRPCSFLFRSAVLSVKIPSEHPRPPRKPFWYSTPTLRSCLSSRDAMMESTTLSITSSSMIPRQLEGLLGSPFLGSSLRRRLESGNAGRHGVTGRVLGTSPIEQQRTDSIIDAVRDRAMS
mmetsp:Transcript_928/g.2567  ORF Transcript_928/g.2567 Transcript_928/m.2567 type:complete len:298 (+) Transcript_928:2794-3687(+)